MKERNKTFKLMDVKEIFMEAVIQVPPELWSWYVQHAKKPMGTDWESEGLHGQSNE